jgi:hypothetical protein
MQRAKLAGLLKLELRDGRVIRLCDGGFVVWGAETFRSKDETFGIIGSMEGMEEGVGDEVPTFSMTFLPVSTAAAAQLSAPGMQGSRMRLWIAEQDVDTDAIIGTPDQQFDGQLDQTKLIIGRGKRELEMSFVPMGERFFNSNDGNTLSSAFHKSIYPGELGEDNATGLSSAVAWGTEAQPGSNGGAAQVYPSAGWNAVNFWNPIDNV